MCCGTSDWKREEVPDHKFDFIDVRDYHDNGWWTKVKYGILFTNVIKSIAVYIADIYTAVTLLAFNRFNSTIYQRVENNTSDTVKVPIQYGKWIFFGCILFSFLLLAYEAHKTRAIVKSRDISYAYTNVMANNYYSIRSYDHFCLFQQINNSTKKKDEIGFFIFFTFKGWKRLLVADAPRQVINALILYGLAEVVDFSTDIEDYYGGNIFTGIMLLTMIFTVIVFAGSAILLIIAVVMYLPLLCYIRGNLKEYCCHKIDKRITELVRLKKKERVAKQAAIARAEAKGDFKHLMNKKGIIVGQKMIHPTLPKVLGDSDLYDEKPALSHSGSSATLTGSRKLNSAGPYMHNGDEYGSQAQLVYNKGYGGGTESLAGHSVQGSVDDFGFVANGGGSIANGMSSIAGSKHNSPETYAVRIRGGAITPGAQAGLMAQLGPIGTSPQLFAQRVQGAGSGTNGGSMSQGNGFGSRSQQGYDHHTPQYQQSQQPSDQYSYQYQQQQHQQAQHQQTDSYSNQNDYASAYDEGSNGAYDYVDGASQKQDVRAYTGDLSAYAPYAHDDQYGNSPYWDHAEVLNDVYDSYGAGENDGYEDQHGHGHGHAAAPAVGNDFFGGTDGFGGGAAAPAYHPRSNGHPF